MFSGKMNIAYFEPMAEDIPARTNIMVQEIKNTTKNFIGITPGVGNALSYGWDAMKKYFLIFLLIAFLVMILDSPTQLLRYDSEHGWGDISLALGFMIFLYSTLFLPVIEYGADLIFLQGTRGDKVEAKDVIIGFNNYVNIILVNILMFALIGISFFLLIIPGIIVSCRLAFVSYLVMDEGLNPIEAVETSWQITRGHAWKIFGLAITCFFICVLGFICLFVGIIPAVMWSKAAFAALYLSITGQKVIDEEADANIVE